MAVGAGCRRVVVGGKRDGLLDGERAQIDNGERFVLGAKSQHFVAIRADGKIDGPFADGEIGDRV